MSGNNDGGDVVCDCSLASGRQRERSALRQTSSLRLGDTDSNGRRMVAKETDGRNDVH